MKYLIIGGTSVFVNPLQENLKKYVDTDQIVVTTRSEIKCTESDPLVNHLQINILDPIEVGQLVKEVHPDVIFDLETQDSVGYAWTYPNETVDLNIIGTINILNAVKELDYKPRLIIGGSGEEYGDPGFDHLPLIEDETPRPVNLFGATKACQTMFAKLYHRAFGLDVIVLRTFNETSKEQDDKWAISSFARQFVKMERGEQEPILHVGNTNIIRDFTNVDDLAKAYIMVAEKGKNGEVYNAARGEGVSIKDVIEGLEDITGLTVSIRSDKSKVRPIDVPCIIADVKKIEQDTGWKAEVTLKDTLVELVEKWRRELSA